jgi:hypothetical protein
MGDGAAGKTLIVPAPRRPSPRLGHARQRVFRLPIFAAKVKIHQSFQLLAISKFSFAYNEPHAQATVMSRGDASPSKMGPRIAIQVWAVGLSTAIKHRCVRCTRLAQPGAARLQRT